MNENDGTDASEVANAAEAVRPDLFWRRTGRVVLRQIALGEPCRLMPKTRTNTWHSNERVLLSVLMAEAFRDTSRECLDQ